MEKLINIANKQLQYFLLLLDYIKFTIFICVFFLLSTNIEKLLLLHFTRG